MLNPNNLALVYKVLFYFSAVVIGTHLCESGWHAANYPPQQRTLASKQNGLSLTNSVSSIFTRLISYGEAQRVVWKRAVAFVKRHVKHGTDRVEERKRLSNNGGKTQTHRIHALT
jgi:hypothetical protein